MFWFVSLKKEIIVRYVCNNNCPVYFIRLWVSTDKRSCHMTPQTDPAWTI